MNSYNPTSTQSVAVCIPTFNQARYLPQAIDSALTQKSVSVEVWVSDDASTDDTEALMERYRDDVRVKYHRQLKNIGIVANGSWVLEQPTTPWIVRLDSDDFLEPDFVDRLLETAEAYPKAGVFHAAVREVDADGRFRRVRRLRRAAGYQMADDAFREACQGYKVAANICLFRTSALRSVGLYRPGTNFVEDWDLWVRLAAHGWGNLYVEAILANYRVWSDASGFRRGRKVTELVGLRHIFEDSLEPAFRERNWSLGPLTVARRRLANGQARALRWVPKESEDYVIMTRELINLGDSRGLRFRIDLVNLGFGWMLDAFARSQVLLRDLAKALLIRLRRIRQNRAKVADDGS